MKKLHLKKNQITGTTLVTHRKKTENNVYPTKGPLRNQGDKMCRLYTVLLHTLDIVHLSVLGEWCSDHTRQC